MTYFQIMVVQKRGT